MTPGERAVYCAAIAAGLKAAKAERARHAAFGKPRKNKAAWADPAVRARQSAIVKAAWEKRRNKADVAYEFRHIRRAASPDAIPAIPTLADALGAR